MANAMVQARATREETHVEMVATIDGLLSELLRIRRMVLEGRPVDGRYTRDLPAVPAA